MRKKIFLMIAGMLLMGVLMFTADSNPIFARFFDRHAITVETTMGKVEVYVSEAAIDGDTVTAAISNESNIDIFLRAGIIVEMLDITVPDDPQFAIAQADAVISPKPGIGWLVTKKTIQDDSGGLYDKYFLHYMVDGSFARISPGSDINEIIFDLTPPPAGYEYLIHIVPEAIQADQRSTALNDLPW